VFTVSCYRKLLSSQSLRLTYCRFTMYLNIFVSSHSSFRHFKEQSTNIHSFLPAVEHHSWELSRYTYRKLTFTYSVLVHSVFSQMYFKAGKYLSHGCMHHTRTHARTHTHINSWKYICIHAYINTYINTHPYIHTHTYIHTCIPTYIHTYIHTYTHTHTHTHTHTYVRTYVVNHVPNYLRTDMLTSCC